MASTPPRERRQSPLRSAARCGRSATARGLAGGPAAPLKVESSVAVARRAARTPTPPLSSLSPVAVGLRTSQAAVMQGRSELHRDGLPSCRSIERSRRSLLRRAEPGSRATDILPAGVVEKATREKRVRLTESACAEVEVHVATVSASAWDMKMTLRVRRGILSRCNWAPRTAMIRSSCNGAMSGCKDWKHGLTADTILFALPVYDCSSFTWCLELSFLFWWYWFHFLWCITQSIVLETMQLLWSVAATVPSFNIASISSCCDASSASSLCSCAAAVASYFVFVNVEFWHRCPHSLVMYCIKGFFCENSIVAIHMTTPQFLLFLFKQSVCHDVTYSLKVTSKPFLVQGVGVGRLSCKARVWNCVKCVFVEWFL